LPSNIDLISAAAKYLVSDSNLANIAGLPLIHHPDGRRITFDPVGSSTIYTMLEEAEFNLFGGYSEDIIALHVLDATLVELLKEHGPTTFSVQLPTPQIIARYLEMDPNPLGLQFDPGNADPSVIRWLSEFWVWLEGWSSKDGLYKEIKDDYLLPSSNGLTMTTAPIFSRSVDPNLFSCLRQLGIPFFHRHFPGSAQQALNSFRSFNDPNNWCDLLDSLSWRQINILRLDAKVAPSVLRHFIQVGSAETTQDQRLKLKALPIFPTIQPMFPMIRPEEPLAIVWASIPRDKNIISVSIDGLRILPTIRNAVFLDGSAVAISFLRILDPNAQGPFSGHDILSLALANFATQAEGIRTGIIEYMVTEDDSLPAPVFEQFLQAMESLSISECFDALRATTHTQFAGWLRNRMPRAPSLLHSVARELPIWRPTQPNAHGSWLKANGLKMLPAGPGATAVIPFLTIPVSLYSSQLESLAVEPMTWGEIFQTIQNTTPRLSPPNKHKYLDFLKALLNATPPVQIPWVLVPNCSDMLCPSNELYAHDALFCATFGSVSPNFIADDFRHFEPQLATDFGLKSERNLNIDMFRECAMAIHNDMFLERARIIFKIYYEKLPLHDCDPQHWDTLDDLNFVPRKAFGRKTMAGRNIWPYLRYRDLLDIVTPKDILLEKYEAIAWTQRTLLLEEPAPHVIQSILSIKANFGQPTISDVVRYFPSFGLLALILLQQVQHLRVLALQMSVDYPQDRALLGDLRTTYQWLDDHLEEAKPIMIQHKSERLFLNVADPETGAWVWCSAQELLFGIRHRRSSFHIQEFLLSFQGLLRESGVETIIEASLPADVDDNVELPAESEPLRSAFCSMRDAKKLTDVVLIPDTEDGEPETTFVAHRAYLAAYSTYFLNAFGGEFQESSAHQPVNMRVHGYSSSSVQVLLGTSSCIVSGTVELTGFSIFNTRLFVHWCRRPGCTGPAY
jgi:BTB/POZ domain